jgi:dUTP pyrophosphatase
MDNNYNLTEIRYKLFEAMDPNIEYSMDDFDKEFSNVSHTLVMPETSTLVVGDLDYRLGVKLVNKSNNPDPEYQTEGAAGFDFRANIDEPITLEPNDIKIIPTGLYFELPTSLELQVRPRSGLAAKHGVTVLNSPGTIDSDYRGEVMVILINHGKEPFKIEHGDRIAQGVINSVMSKETIRFELVDELGDTERGEGKFGSTGKK